MNIGYARVSTFDQTLILQQDAPAAAQCERVSTDTISGAKNERPGQCARGLAARPHGAEFEDADRDAHSP